MMTSKQQQVINEVSRQLDTLSRKLEALVSANGNGVRPTFPKIVCLCGSTRFADTFAKENLRLTLEGVIVLSIGANVSDSALGISQDSQTKANLDELHLRKIDLADEVFVLNVNGYIGESTRREIQYAESIGKPVTYLDGNR